jgi:hypothetical protein
MNLPLEKQLTSLEVSQRMKELGFKQESYFAWCKEYYDPLPPTRVSAVRWVLIGENEAMEFDTDEEYSAYTVAELGELLKMITFALPEYDGTEWVTMIKIEDGSYRTFNADIEADARGKMLCYLKDNNLI